MGRQVMQQQMSVDELRVQLSKRLRASASFSKTVYRDQPIIMTGRQMRSFVPDAISAARQIARRSDMRHAGVAALFLEQARFLADYEDDFEFTGTFSHYYPSYEDMNNEQLRGYFAWRTRVRQGHVALSSLSFAFLYTYELIHLVGTNSPLEAYMALRNFGTSYKRLDKRFARYFDLWLDDFVIYYQLDPALLSTLSFTAQDAAFGVLERWESSDDRELFDALCTLSSYAISDSPFFLEHESELQRLSACAYRTVASHHDAKLKTTLCAKLFGRAQTEPYTPFARAVFSDPLKIEHLDYQISPYDTVSCRGGAWFRTRYAALEAPVPWIAKLLETCESILRDAYEFPNALEQSLTTKYLVAEARRMAAALVSERRQMQERAVHIDFEKLDAIRQASDVTCEKLIIEEDGAVAAPKAPALELLAPSPQPARQMPAASSSTCDHGLSPTQRALVETLLAGKSVREFEHAHACIASVLFDAINEKLYDEFSDICIDTGSNGPQIIEDYADELRGMFAKD